MLSAFGANGRDAHTHTYMSWLHFPGLWLQGAHLSAHTAEGHMGEGPMDALTALAAPSFFLAALETWPNV